MTHPTLRVLLVEDDDDHADLVAAYLEDAVDPAVTLVRVGTVREGLAALAESGGGGASFGAVLTDQQLPDSEFWETVPRLVAAAEASDGGPPVIALTSIGDLDVALDALAQGAQDYVVKSEMSTEVLQRAIRYAVERARHATELRTTNEALRQTLDHVRQMQAQLVEQEKLAGLGRFMGGVAHRLMNPLYLALNYAAEAAERASDIATLDIAEPDHEAELADLVEDLQTNARKVIEHVRRTDTVIRSMFEHSRGVAGNLQLVVLADAVESAVQRAEASSPDTPVERGYTTGGGPLVYGVAAAIARMVYNVVENAVVAGRQPGALAPDVRVTVLHDTGPGQQPLAVVEVSDRGPGIPEDVLPSVFEPFFTAWGPPSQRIGLGLALAHTIVSSHGGRIDVHASAPGGTTVRIALPAGVPDLDATSVPADGAEGEAFAAE